MNPDDPTGHAFDETADQQRDLQFEEFLAGLEHTADRDAFVQQFCERYPDRAAEFREQAEIERKLRPPAAGSVPEYMGDFKIIDIRDTGGMGEVYKAEQISLKRPVALKLIRPRRGYIAPALRERFKNEQLLLAKLHHTNVVAIYTCGEELVDGQPLQYFAMPLIDGVSLEHVVQTARGYPSSHPGEQTPSLDGLVQLRHDSPTPVPRESTDTDTAKAASADVSNPNAPRPVSSAYWRSVCECVMKIAQAVQHAHDHDVLHRDLKPHNVMINSTGECFVIDFGLARLLQSSGIDESGDSDQEQRDHSRTPIAGTSGIGTLHYRAPEQLTGEVDVRTDVWGLGTILYELLTLTRPFGQPEITNEMLFNGEHFSQLTSPRRAAPRLPRDLQAICLKCLACDPEDRYQSARAVAEDLDNWLRDLPVEARQGDWSDRAARVWKLGRRHPVITSASAIIVASITAVILLILANNHQLEIAYAGEKAERTTAQNERDKAKELAESIADFRYAARMATAAQSWKNDNIAQARRLIEEQIPKNPDAKDRRGWEWHLLNLVTRGGSPILKGHTGPVLSVDCHPNGKLAVTGGKDSTARIWNIETGRQLRILKGHNGPVIAVAFSPDGSLVATASQDGNAMVWETATGKFRRVLSGHILPINDVTFSPDGKKLVTASDDATIKVWNVTTGSEFLTLSGHSNRVTAIAITPDGGTVVSGGADRTVQMYDLASGQRRESLKFTNGIQGLTLSRNGERLALAVGTSGAARKVLIVDARTGMTLHELKLELEKSSIQDIELAPNGISFAVALKNNTVRIFRSPIDKQPLALRGHSHQVNAIAFTPDGMQVTTASDDSNARVWNSVRITGRTQLDGHRVNVTALAFSPDGSRLLSGSYDTTVRLWNPRTGQEVARLGGGQLIQKFNPKTGRIESQEIDRGRGDTAHGHFVLDAAFSRDGRYIATAGFDNVTKLWDARNGKLLHNLHHPSQVFAVAFRPDGRQLATAGWGDAVRTWDVEAGAQTQELWGHKDHIADLAYSPDGRVIASASYDGTVRLWNSTTGKNTHVLEGHQGHVNSVAFDPKGRWLASGGDDRTIRIWSIENGNSLKVLEGHEGTVRQIVIAPDGSQLASVGSRAIQGIRIWETSSWRQTMMPSTIEGKSRIAFSPDGWKLATIVGTSIRIWDATPLKRQKPALAPPPIETRAAANNNQHMVKALGYALLDALPSTNGNGKPDTLDDKRGRFLVIMLSVPQQLLMLNRLEFAALRRQKQANGHAPPPLQHQNRIIDLAPEKYFAVLASGQSSKGRRIANWPEANVFAGGFTRTRSEALDPDARVAMAVAWPINPTIHKGPYRVRIKGGPPVEVPEVRLNPDRFRHLKRVWHQGPVRARRPRIR